MNEVDVRMRVMFMARCYAPEDVSGAVLITELATDLGRRGLQVTIVTGDPDYPYGRVFPGFRNRTYQVEWLSGVRVVRTWGRDHSAGKPACSHDSGRGMGVHRTSRKPWFVGKRNSKAKTTSRSINRNGREWTLSARYKVRPSILA